MVADVLGGELVKIMPSGGRPADPEPRTHRCRRTAGVLLAAAAPLIPAPLPEDCS